MKIGYARVSTRDQDPSLQVDALEAAGCGRVFTEYASGASADRPVLKEMLGFAREGDAVVIWKLDRLFRSTKDMLALSEGLGAGGVGLVSLTDSIDTTTPQGRLFFTVMSAMAQFERDLVVERTRAGLEAARARGRKGGRPPADPARLEHAMLLYDRGDLPVAEVCRRSGVSRSVLYRGLERRATAASIDPDGSGGRA